MRCGIESKGTGSKSIFSRRVICPLNLIPVHRMLPARHLLPRHKPDASFEESDGPQDLGIPEKGGEEWGFI